jgi:hypothetical protein
LNLAVQSCFPLLLWYHVLKKLSSSCSDTQHLLCLFLLFAQLEILSREMTCRHRY